MRLLTVQEVLYIHFQVIDRFGGLHGVRDSGGLESAATLCTSILPHADIEKLIAAKQLQAGKLRPGVDLAAEIKEVNAKIRNFNAKCPSTILQKKTHLRR